MLTAIRIDTAEEQAMYLFTKPAHPAHPAFIASTLGPSGNENTAESTLAVGYAGSEVELENFVRSFLDPMRSAVERSD